MSKFICITNQLISSFPSVFLFQTMDQLRHLLPNGQLITLHVSLGESIDVWISNNLSQIIVSYIIHSINYRFIQVWAAELLLIVIIFLTGSLVLHMEHWRTRNVM